MEELPGKLKRSSIAFLTGAASGITLALVLIGSEDDSSGHPAAAMLNYAILATAMVASIYGFMIPMDSVAEKWMDLSSSHVTHRSIGFVSRVLRDAKPMTMLGVALVFAEMLLVEFGYTRLQITELGFVIAFVSEVSTFSTAIAATFVVVFKQVQALDHWGGDMRPVWVAMLGLMVIALWHILSRVAKAVYAFVAVCVACFYVSMFALMIILTPVVISIHCLSQCLGRSLLSILVIAVGSATVVVIQGAVGPAALFIPDILLNLSKPDTKLGHGFWFLAVPITAVLGAAKFNLNLCLVELDLKRKLILALGVDTVQTFFYIGKLALLFGVPVMLAISSAVAVQIFISPVPKHGGRLLAWAAKGAALGSAIVLRLFGESLIYYGLINLIVVWIIYHCFLQNSQGVTPQHASQLHGMHIATFVIGCGVALFPRHYGLVMTGLWMYIAIKAVKLWLELEEEDTMLPERDNIINEEEYGIGKNMVTTHRRWS